MVATITRDELKTKMDRGERFNGLRVDVDHVVAVTGARLQAEAGRHGGDAASLGLANAQRASDTSWRWPAEKLAPCWDTSVSSPAGNERT